MPLSPSVWSRPFPGTPEQVAAARRFAVAVAPRTTDPDAVRTVVSELVTNALVYTASGRPDGWFVVQVTDIGDRVRIRVFDLGDPVSTPHIAGDMHDLDAESGRGLAVVAALAKDWGVDGDGGGYAVWADLTT
jgi:anti-sigma regulatory factor (Ser/Thr protein kinase)